MGSPYHYEPSYPKDFFLKNVKYLIVSISLPGLSELLQNGPVPQVTELSQKDKSHKEFCSLLFFLKRFSLRWAWWHVPLMLALLGQRQENL